MSLQSVHLSWIKATTSELKNEWNKLDFIQKTIAQIDKDFASFSNSNIGDNINLNGEVIVDITQHIYNNLNKMEREQPASIPQLIYLIDIPELLFQSIYQNASSINHELAQCILIREAHKVWMRGRY